MNRSYYRPLEYRQRYWPTDYYFVNRMNRLQEIEDFNDYKNLIYRLMMQKQKQQREMELAKYIKKTRRNANHVSRRNEKEKTRRNPKKTIRRNEKERRDRKKEIKR